MRNIKNLKGGHMGKNNQIQSISIPVTKLKEILRVVNFIANPSINYDSDVNIMREKLIHSMIKNGKYLKELLREYEIELN